MKYLIFTLAVLMIFAGSIFFLFEQDVSAGYNGDLGINHQQLTLTLLGPYGQKIGAYGKEIGNNDGRGYMGSREFTQVSLEFDAHEIAENTRSSENDYCGEGGGNYYLSYYLNVKRSKSGSNHKEEKRVFNPVYNCSTTKELLELVKVPQEWESEKNTLSIYCSEPGKTSKGENPDKPIIYNPLSISSFLFSTLGDVHVACLIRNEDTQESVLYGFPYGNKKLEKPVVPFINESKENPTSIAQGYTMLSEIKINDQSEMMEFEKEISANENQKMYISYFNQTNKPYFILSQDSSYLSNLVGLSSLFDLDKITDQTARTVLLRKFENRTIYGFQTQEELIGMYTLPEVQKVDNVISRKLNPIYIINYDGFGTVSKTCMDSLAKHRPSTTIGDKSTTTVVCMPDTILIQPSNLNDASHTPDLGFTLFKNIISKANGNGVYIGSSYYDNQIGVIYRSRDSLYPTILPPPEPEEE